jgi:hypothetical protein
MWKTHRVPFEPSDRICNVCFGLDPNVALECQNKSRIGLCERVHHNVSIEGMELFKGNILRITVPLSDLSATANDCSSCWMLISGINEITANGDDVPLEHDSFDKHNLSVVIYMVHRPFESKQHTVKVSLFEDSKSTCRTMSGGPRRHIKQLEYYTLSSRFHFTICVFSLLLRAALPLLLARAHSKPHAKCGGQGYYYVVHCIIVTDYQAGTTAASSSVGHFTWNLDMSSPWYHITSGAGAHHTYGSSDSEKALDMLSN